MAHDTWGQGDSLRRLIQLAFRNECRYVATLEDARSVQWAEESSILYGDIAHQLQDDKVQLLLFLKSQVKDETELRNAIASGRVVGYAILRPRPLGSVVEAFIAPPASSDIHYITCQSRATFALPNVSEKLEVSLVGLPFMQQDGAVSRCADASLWMASSLVSKAHPEWTDCKVLTHDVVADALQYFPAIGSRRMPSGGLNTMEMMLAFERSGYNPVPYDFDTDAKKAKSDHTVYRWIESGIPVILCLQLEKDQHTVVVCGHTFDPDAWWPGARTDYFPSLASEDRWLSSSLWATQYLVLDDNYGPMLAMTRGSLRTRSYKAIVPVPKSAKIHLTPEDAETIAALFLFRAARFATVPVGAAAPWLELLEKAVQQPDKRFVLRTLLVKSADFLEAVGASYSTAVREISEGLQVPDFLWLVEVSLPEIYGDKLKLGEIVLNPMIPWNLFQKLQPYLWVNLAGQVWIPGMPEAKYVGMPEPVPLLQR